MLDPQNYRNWPYANFTFSSSEELVLRTNSSHGVKFAKCENLRFNRALMMLLYGLKWHNLTFCILGEWFCRLLIFKLHFSKDVLSVLIWVQTVCKRLQSDDASSQWGIGKLSPSTSTPNSLHSHTKILTRFVSAHATMISLRVSHIFCDKARVFY